MSPEPQANRGVPVDQAQALAQRFPLAVVAPGVADFLRDKQSQTWAVACSGGADSTFLVLWLAGVFGHRSARTLLLHFDHATRPREQHERDARHVQWLAQQFGFEIIIGHNPAAATAASEETLRLAREQFFAQQLKASGAEVLLLGHQRDDVLETFLMRAARGSGLEGLAAPRPLNWVDGIARVRPLLTFSAKELRTTLSELAVPWCEDISNAGQAYARNRIRQKVLPAWRQALEHDPGAGVARSRALLQEAAEGIRTLALELYGGQLPAGETLPLAPLSGRPPVLWRWVLGRWLENLTASGSLQANAFEALLRAARSGQGQISFGSEHALQVANGSLRVVPLAAASTSVHGSAALIPAVTVCWPDETSLWLEQLPAVPALCERIRSGAVDSAREVWLDADKVVLPLRVRSWCAGDRLQPLGMKGERKLQDVFTDAKIPRGQRCVWPVLVTDDDRVVWLPGMPPAQWAAVDEKTRSLLRVGTHFISRLERYRNQ